MKRSVSFKIFRFYPLLSFAIKPCINLVAGSIYAGVGAVMVALAGIFSFRSRAAEDSAQERS